MLRCAQNKLAFLAVILITAFLSNTRAQTVITGKVTDIQTFEPVFFADVVFKGTTTGTNTAFDGTFTLKGKTESDSITVSFIGYESKTVAIVQGIEQVVNIQLHPATYSIGEVTVRPGENPAITLLRKVWKNIPSNHIGKLESFRYENYSRSSLFVRKTGYYRKNDSRFIKPFSKEFEKYSVKTGTEDIPAIPSYFTESLSDNYYRKSTGEKLTRIRAARSDGIAFENTSLPAQLISGQENFNFMDNTVLIIDKSFVSPLSRSGPLYYKYYLTDSLILDKRYYCYEVNFKPRNEEGPVFHGTFWINDTTFALKRISVELGQKAELNFIRRIKIQQDYEPVDSSAWFPVNTRFMADAANLFITNISQKSGIIVNQPVSPGYFSSQIRINYNAGDFDNRFWNTARTAPLEKIDTLAIMKIDSLKTVSRIGIAAKLIEASIRGYYNFGKFEAGPYLLSYDHNTAEGSRFRLGGRTNINFSEKVILEGYAAYGTKDKKIKGSVQAEYFLSKERWARAGVQYRSDIENAGALDEFYSRNSFLTFATSFGGSDKMSWSEVVRTWVESDLLRGLQGKLVFTRKTFRPATPGYYFAYYSDPERTILKSSYTTAETGLILRYQPKAVFVLDGIRRFPVNFNQYPVFSLEYFRGFRNLTGGDFNYDKIVGGISQKFNPWGLGSVSYNLLFTKIFGTVPYPLLNTLAGNESIFRTDRTYNLMNYGEFIADETLELFLAYHMNGLLLGKIPLLKKLDLRTVITADAAFGSLNNRHNGFYDPITNPGGILPKKDPEDNQVIPFHTLSYSHPYAELSYGIENVFRFFRIDLVHRLTYLDNPGSRRFAIKISGNFRF